MKTKNEELIISILIPLAVGILASLLTGNAMQMFERVSKPPLSPPGWVFPVVWTILYVLMGIASYLIYRQGGDDPEVMRALKTYALQLVFNFFWSFFFFKGEWYWFSFLWLVVLWLLILSAYDQFRRINETAAYLLIPYLAWVAFAGYLNLGIAVLN